MAVTSFKCSPSHCYFVKTSHGHPAFGSRCGHEHIHGNALYTFKDLTLCPS
ncbi:hypothetical protein HanIR_Chr13g0626971 [Helianthus annuus]|nr:hypothetical protein HanIR_Chr13g0626971 [Helianthus annuus]